MTEVGGIAGTAQATPAQEVIEWHAANHSGADRVNAWDTDPSTLTANHPDGRATYAHHPASD